VRRISPTEFRVARRGTSREINRQIALNLVRSKQPVSRAELARLMGMRRGAVTRLVDELLASGLVFEGAKGESRRGRKPTHLQIDTRRRCVVAVDVSASRTSILATDLLGHPLLEVVEFPTPIGQAGPLVEELARRIRDLLQEHPRLGSCVGIGVAVSGLVDVTGVLTFSPTLGLHGVDLLTEMKAATGLPVVVENSTKACVLGQVWAVRGDAPVEGLVAFVDVSDGVGVGVAVDGKLLRGARNVAGEFGHVPLETHGPRCACGLRGCLEAYASKRATIARYRGTDLSWPGSVDTGSVTIEHVISRARAGDERAVEALRGTGYSLGRGFATLIKALDPTRIYVGGEVTEAWDLVLPAVRDALYEDPIIREAGETEILTVPLGEQSRLRGAAALIHTPAFAAPVVS
jgi:predicted NBD/HSP70 family sugar kinase/biotin operon repressor